MTRTPLSASIREHWKQAKRDRKRSIRKCRLLVVAKQRNMLQKLTDKSRKARRAVGMHRLERLLKTEPREFYKHYRKPPTSVPQEELSDHFEELLGAEPPDLPVPPIIPGTTPPPESIEGLQRC